MAEDRTHNAGTNFFSIYGTNICNFIEFWSPDIDTYPNFYTGECPDDDPYWENDLRCVFHSNENHNRDRKVWREAFDNLIKYGPLDPQTMFIQGWVHEDLEQHTQDNFQEDWQTRFLRFAAEEGFP